MTTTENFEIQFRLSNPIAERKLAKLKSDPNILTQLQARREQCMEQLLLGNLNLDQEQLNNINDEDIEANRLQRFIQPEQPISGTELIHIIEHDHLDETDESPQAPATNTNVDQQN